MIDPKDSDKFKQLIGKGYSLDYLWILGFINSGGDIDDLSKDSSRIGNIIATVHRKGLISDNHNLTIEGKELLSFLSSPIETKLVKTKPKDDNFKLWWDTFSPTDTFEYKGKKFNGSRALRTKKEDCKLKLNKILSEGEYTINELIDALKLEIHQKKEQSFKTGQNKLSYFQNSLTYLNQKSYEAYCELIKAGHKVKEEKVVSNETYI